MTVNRTGSLHREQAITRAGSLEAGSLHREPTVARAGCLESRQHKELSRGDNIERAKGVDTVDNRAKFLQSI